MADTQKASDSSASKSPKKAVTKSPKYPYLAFPDALEKAQTIYGFEKRNPTTADVMLSHLGFKTRTGPANRTLAALRAYGLLQRQAGGNYAISDRAWRILVALPQDSAEREKLVRDAALSPSLFKEIIALYPSELPSDATLRSHLLIQKGFNENSVERFLKVFKAAITVAKPYDSDYTPSGSEDDAEDDEEDNDVQQQENTQQQRQQFNKPPGDQYYFKPLPGASMEFTFYLSQTKRGVLSVPLEMTAKEWKLLKKQIDSSLDVAEATALVEESPEPQPADRESAEGVA